MSRKENKVHTIRLNQVGLQTIRWTREAEEDVEHTWVLPSSSQEKKNHRNAHGTWLLRERDDDDECTSHHSCFILFFSFLFKNNNNKKRTFDDYFWFIFFLPQIYVSFAYLFTFHVVFLSLNLLTSSVMTTRYSAQVGGVLADGAHTTKKQTSTVCLFFGKRKRKEN